MEKHELCNVVFMFVGTGNAAVEPTVTFEAARRLALTWLTLYNNLFASAARKPCKFWKQRSLILR